MAEKSKKLISRFFQGLFTEISHMSFIIQAYSVMSISSI